MDEIPTVAVLFLRKVADGKTLIVGVIDGQITDTDDSFCIADLIIDSANLFSSTSTIGVSYPSVLADFGNYARTAYISQEKNKCSVAQT